MDQWLYSISDHCFDDLTNYRQNCYSSIVDGIIFASDVKRCTLSYFASFSSSETTDRWGWQYGSKRLGMVYWTQHVRANQIEFATCSSWTSKHDVLQMQGTDHLTWRGGGGLWFFVLLRIFFSDNTRARIFILFPEFNIRLYDKNSESYFFFPPPKSEYFFQRHWE